MDKRAKHFYEFDGFRLDVGERLLLRKGKELQLTPKAFDTLLVLVQHSGRILKKDFLLSEIWRDSFVGEATLAKNISDLRKLLDDTRDQPQFIETIAKRGYRFIAVVREMQEATPAAQDDDGTLIAFAPHANRLNAVVQDEPLVKVHTSGQLLMVQPEPLLEEAPIQQESLQLLLFEKPHADSGSRVPIGKLTIGSILALAITGVLFVAFWPRSSEPEFTARSIAVLPFKFLSSTNGDREFDMGMTDTLITKLGQVKRIVVRPISAV